jgi:hypothetical protein
VIDFAGVLSDMVRHRFLSVNIDPEDSLSRFLPSLANAFETMSRIGSDVYNGFLASSGVKIIPKVDFQ